MTKPNTPIIGLTHGDINSTNYEEIIKVCAETKNSDMFTPVVYGTSKAVSYHRNLTAYTNFNFNIVKSAAFALEKKPNIVNITNAEIKITLGEATEASCSSALQSIENAINDLKNKNIEILVATPVDTEQAFKANNLDFDNHSNYLAKSFEIENFLDILVHNSLRIASVSGVTNNEKKPENISYKSISQSTELFINSLKKDFLIGNPKIAILDTNSCEGCKNEIAKMKENIVSVIKKQQDKGNLVYGPFVAEDFFGNTNYNLFDGILTMSCEQARLPFKILSGNQGAIFSAGLPFIATFPLDGVNFENAGKNKTNPEQLRNAIYLAIDVYKNRNIGI